MELAVDARRLSAALASLSHGGFRGKRVEIPEKDLPAVKANLRQAYEEIGKGVPKGLQL